MGLGRRVRGGRAPTQPSKFRFCARPLPPTLSIRKQKGEGRSDISPAPSEDTWRSRSRRGGGPRRSGWKAVSSERERVKDFRVGACPPVPHFRQTSRCSRPAWRKINGGNRRGLVSRRSTQSKLPPPPTLSAVWIFPRNPLRISQQVCSETTFLFVFSLVASCKSSSSSSERARREKPKPKQQQQERKRKKESARAGKLCDEAASLCWGCDEKVHGANFLVAKHARALLCHVCQSPTPWKASGPRLGPTVSVCERCRRICDGKAAPGARGCAGGDEEAGDCDGNDVDEVLDDDDGYADEGGDEEEEEEEVDDEEEEEEAEEEEDGENQVVPLSRDSPPPVASSSTEDESTSRSVTVAGDGRFNETVARGGLRMKRSRQSEDLDSDDEVGCVSSGLNSRALDNEEEATSSSALPRPTKRQRAAAAAVETNPMATSGGGRVGGVESLMSALKRLLQRSAAAGNAAAAVSGICRLSGYHQSR
ncbi:hypothetical protein NL676_024201 [Syzygium grande]|nr:hypothetical protein NL676_024201 [Syzygium grande]